MVLLNFILKPLKYSSYTNMKWSIDKQNDLTERR